MIHNIEKDSNICVICDTNITSNNLECKECSKAICLECCNKLTTRKISLISYDEIYIKYNCPFCRNDTKIDVNNFDKNEILELYKINLKSYVSILTENKNNINEITALKLVLLKLKKENNEKNNKIENISNSLKNVIEINKHNNEKYDSIIKKYKEYTKLE